MSLEEDFPGLDFEIKTLRQNGLQDDQILSAISSRVETLSKSGYGGTAINAWLKGQPGPVTTPVDPKVPLSFQPGVVKQYQQYEESTRMPVGVDPYTGKYRGAHTGSKLADTLLDAPMGLFKGISDAARASGRTFLEELSGAPDQFIKGMGKVFSKESTPLERVLGGMETVIAPLRGVMAPITAITKPTQERAIDPLVEKYVGELPAPGTLGRMTYDFATQTALSGPFIGVVPKVPKAEAAAIAKMEQSTRLGESVFAKMTTEQKRAYLDETPPGGPPPGATPEGSATPPTADMSRRGFLGLVGKGAVAAATAPKVVSEIGGTVGKTAVGDTVLAHLPAGLGRPVSEWLMSGPNGVYSIAEQIIGGKAHRSIGGSDTFFEGLDMESSLTHQAMKQVLSKPEGVTEAISNLGGAVSEFVRGAAPEVVNSVRRRVGEMFGDDAESAQSMLHEFDQVLKHGWNQWDKIRWNKEVPGKVTQEGATVQDASHATSPEDVQLRKVETSQGEASVVAETTDGTQIVTKTPEDVGTTYAKNVQEEEAKQAAPELKTSLELTPAEEPWKVGEEGLSQAQKQIIVANSLAKKQNIPIEQAMEKIKGLSPDLLDLHAKNAVREFRIETGELTGKRGRPKGKESLQLGQHREVQGFDVSAEAAPPQEGLLGEMAPTVSSLQERVRGGEVTLPTRPSLKDMGLVTFNEVRRQADKKGMEIVNQQGKIYLFKPGGASQEFASLRDAQHFLMTKDDLKLEPVHVKPVEGGESAFEAAVQGKDLTKDQRKAVREQKGLIESQGPLDMIGQDPQRKFELPEGSLFNSTESVSRPEAMKLFAAARKAGFESRLIRAGQGWEVAYYQKATPALNRALALYKKQLSGKELTAEELIEMGAKPIGGGAGPMEGFAKTIGVDQPSEGKIRFANQLAGGMVSGSPIIRQMTREMAQAEMAFNFRMEGFGKLLSKLHELVPDSKRAFRLKEGTVAPASEAEQEFLNTATSLTQDFARRARAQGQLDEAKILENYAPHITNQEAVWQAFRTQFVSATKFTDLPTQLQLKITPEEFTSMRDTFFKNASVKSVPKDTLRVMREKVFEMDDVATTWESLPQFIRERLPKELFVQFFLPRTDGKFFKEDFYQGMVSYIKRVESSLNFTPWLDKNVPIINTLPGAGSMFTERGFLERLANNAILRRPTWDAQETQNIMNRVNNAIGKEFFRLDDLNVAAQLLRNSTMRGALGPDSAIVNLSQSLYTWAETGRFIGPLFKLAQAKLQGNIPTGVFSEFMRTMGPEVTSERRVMQKLLDFDRGLTKIVLSPMSLTENINRGIAYFAGIEDAIAKGKNATDAMLVGFSRASDVVPNLQMTEAQLHAMELVTKTQLGSGPATRAPMLVARSPLSRISTMLLAFPAHTGQFIQTGLRDGFSDAILKHEPSKLIRYLATTGFLVGMPYIAHKMGADITNMFGAQALLPLVAFPAFRGVRSGIDALVGDDPQSKDRAWTDFKRFAAVSTIPQYRFGAKTLDVVQNIERGYAVDRRMRFMYDTSPWGETMRLLGINPEVAYSTRAVSHTLLEMSHQYKLDKQKALDGILDGDMGPAQRFMQQWQQPIKPEDLQETMKARMTTPMQRAMQGLPKGIRPKMLMEAEE
jgi:hypothetical protein